MTKDQYLAAARDLLHQIELGTIGVQMVEGDILVGKVEYRTSNGWTIIV